MLSIFPGMGGAVQEMKERIEQGVVMKDVQIVPHVANVLGSIDKAKNIGDIVHVSNIVKQTTVQPKVNIVKKVEVPVPVVQVPKRARDCVLVKFSGQNQKLNWAGYGLPKEEVYMVDKHLTLVAQTFKAEEVRFWGKILGSSRDYYIIQGRTTTDGGLQQIPKGAEKRGEGINYYSFWVTNNIYSDQWTELPLITPQHIKISRKIKKTFTGDLFKPFVSYPLFGSEERYYLKAQLVRMTASLEIVPKGIFKPNDDNAKVIEYEDEAKIPQFGELSSAETWVHRNANVLNMGRCTHWIDPATPEDQLETVTAELAEKDPEIQRLRGIGEDKLPEGNPLGVQNIWQSKVVGDTQVFQKEQASFVYAVAVFKNILWPGWVTVAYKGGFCNFYIGFGHKCTQANWCEYDNADLAEQAQELEQCHEPTPKDEPKPAEAPPAEGEEPAQEDQ